MAHRALQLAFRMSCVCVTVVSSARAQVPQELTVQSAPSEEAPARDTYADSESLKRWDDLKLLLEGHCGFGTPFGAVGVAVGYYPIRYFGVVGGGGQGMSGPQLAAGVRARAPLGVVALGVELLYSGGRYEEDSGYPSRHWEYAHWLNFGPAIEFRAERGFSARIYAGYGTTLNRADSSCGPDTIECWGSGSLGYFGTAFGVAL
jgi:hypothetical protein